MQFETYTISTIMPNEKALKNMWKRFRLYLTTHSSVTVIILAALLATVGCSKKPQDVNVELVTVENEVKTIGSTQAYFECEFEYLNEITKALLVYCEDDQLKYAQTSKLEYVDGKWLTQMNYLEKKTKYYYRYEFYNGYNLMWTEIFNFTTTDQQDKPSL